MISLQQAKEEFQTVKKNWKEMITKGQEYREKYLMDFHSNNIEQNTEIQKKLRKQIIKQIQKEHRRNKNFHYLTKFAGKDLK